MNEKHDRVSPKGEAETQKTSDWDKRILCSDGNCIGIIGPDGKCKECGKPYEGELPEGFMQDSAATPPTTPADAEKSGSHETEAEISQSAAETSPTPDDSDWDQRILCSDGNCIGVIGPDGRCKECGKPYEPDSDAAEDE